jgi:hypothetical protein
LSNLTHLYAFTLYIYAGGILMRYVAGSTKTFANLASVHIATTELIATLYITN